MKTQATSITVRGLSADTKARLAARAKRRGRSLEAELRTILDAAASEAETSRDQFPDWLIDMVEPGEDITPFIEEHRRAHPPAKL